MVTQKPEHIKIIWTELKKKLSLYFNWLKMIYNYHQAEQQTTTHPEPAISSPCVSWLIDRVSWCNLRHLL